MIKVIVLISIVAITNNRLVLGQPARVGIIDFYGAASRESEWKKCLPFMENDSLTFLNKSAYPIARKQITDCLLNQQNIKQAEISFICCDDKGRWIVFVGVDTKPAKHFENVEYTDIRLPIEMTTTYNSLMDQIMIAAEKGEMSEDNSNGHALTNYPPARQLEEKCIGYANENLSLLREVLRNSNDRKQREVAAAIIAYYHDKRAIIDDLINAVTDPDEGVRNTAVRAIGIIAQYSLQKPELKIKIPADPFIDMMHSISWTDRNKGGFVLQSLTQNRNKELLKQIRQKALQPIVEMAKWKSPVHSFSGFVILGRMADWSEVEIMNGANDRKEESITKMLNSINKKY